MIKHGCAAEVPFECFKRVKFTEPSCVDVLLNYLDRLWIRVDVAVIGELLRGRAEVLRMQGCLWLQLGQNAREFAEVGLEARWCPFGCPLGNCSCGVSRPGGPCLQKLTTYGRVSVVLA